MEQLEFFEKEMSKTELEGILAGGKTMELSEQQRNPALSERFNIHPGEVYRLIIAGMNPMDQERIDGVLEKVVAYFDRNGFTLEQVTMRHCLVSDDFSMRPSAHEVIGLGRGDRLMGFGSIIDSEGFWRAYKREVERGGGVYDNK